MTMKDIVLFTEIAKRRKNADFIEEMTLADYPVNMKSEQRRKLHRNIYKEAYPEQTVEKIVTTDDIRKMGFKGLNSNG